MAQDSGLCDLYPPSIIATRLRELPHLRSLTMRMNPYRYLWHGLPWNTLTAILSTPHLRDFKLQNIYFCPALLDNEEICVESLSPLTSFHYQMRHPRQPSSFPSETTALDVVLHKLSRTLETLTLMSEPAPINTLFELQWPRLRKLVMYGAPWKDLSAPFVTLCSGMQSLRCLELKLTLIPRSTPLLLYPPGISPPFPWPTLDRLLISYPSAQDGVFDFLPPTLHSLALRCWPHIYIQCLYNSRVTYRSQHYRLLRSSAMLSILRRCAALPLSCLEIEYRADDEDDALLHFLATTFPDLRYLKIHRYRQAYPGETDAPPNVVSLYVALVDPGVLLTSLSI